MWRGFYGMDVEMIRERMARVQLQYRIECGDNLVGAGIRLTLKCPLVPRPKVHHRFGEQRAHIDVVGESLPDFTHRVGISLIERTAVLRLRMCVTFAEGIDQRLLDF